MNTRTPQLDSGTRRNLAAYYLNFCVVAAVGFVVNPLLLSALGPVMFGAWKSLQRYLDFATVADGRGAQALKWIVASRTALTPDEKRRDVGAAVRVWLSWLPAATLIVGGLLLAMPLLVKGIPDHAMAAVYTAAAILGANTLLSGLLLVPDAVLVGVNKGYRSMLVTTAAFLLSNCAMVAAAMMGWPLWSLAIIVLCAAAGNSIVTLLVTMRTVGWWGIARPTPADRKRVLGYSAWTLGWVAVDKLFLLGELIVISVTVGVIAVTQFTFTTYVMQFVLSIAMATASGFIPRLGERLGRRENAEAAILARTIRHLVIGVVAVGVGAVLAFNGTVVTLWVGHEQYLGSLLNILLVLSGLQFALIRMDGQILDVTMRIGPKVITGLVSSAGGVALGCLSYALTHELAAAIVAMIAMRLISNVMYPLFVARAIPGSGVAPRTLVVASVFLAVSATFGLLTPHTLTPVTAGMALAWIVLAAAASWLGLVPRQTMRDLISRKRAA